MTDEGAAEGPSPEEPDDARTIRHLLRNLEELLIRSERQVVEEIERVGPAWLRATEGEPRWQVSLGVIAALVMQVRLPEDIVLRPRWLLPTLGVVLFVALILANPRRISRGSPAIRILSMTLIATISLSNAWSAARLIGDIVRGTEVGNSTSLLVTGGAIWLTNVIAFALWYWELDRGGPIARANATRKHPDFLFAQMQNPEIAPDDWEPQFFDYLYLSFTNASAFSPTDVLPLSRWAKLTMLAQSAVSLTTLVLVVARTVNKLR